MQFKQYPIYKDSGVEWLGDVPEHWEVVRLDGAYKIVRGNTGFSKADLLETGQYVALQYGKTYKVDEINNSFTSYVNQEFFKVTQIAEFEDIILISTSETLEDLGHSCFYARQDIGLIGGEQFLLKPNQKDTLGKYLYYSTKVFSRYLHKYATGTKVYRFNIDDLKTIYIPKLSSFDQQKIVSFLDTETTRIDNLISKQEKLIELLEEQRKSIISHAVTKGLDPNAPMKDSGVKWLGEVPDHWIISRVKFNFRNLDSKRIPLTSEERSYRQGDYPYYGASGIIDYVDSFIFEEDLVLFSEDGANLTYRSMPISFVATGKYWVNNHAHILKPFDSLTAYWACVLESVDVNLSITGATQPKVTAENLGNICISFPPSFEERLSINNYILEESLKIDTLILKQNQLIEKLKEYRSSIISHAVTGKIDVREFGA